MALPPLVVSNEIISAAHMNAVRNHLDVMEDGSLATPGLRFLADQDTGFYRGAADALTIVTGGAPRMTCSSSGIDLHSQPVVNGSSIACGSVSATGAISCATLTSTGVSRVGTSEFGNGFAEIGKYGSGDRPAYFDFHAHGTPGSIDYDCRFLRDPGVNGDAVFSNAGTGKMRFSSAGGLQFENAIIMTTLPSSNPGAGSRQLWYNPADNNRVYYQP